MHLKFVELASLILVHVKILRRHTWLLIHLILLVVELFLPLIAVPVRILASHALPVSHHHGIGRWWHPLAGHLLRIHILEHSILIASHHVHSVLITQTKLTIEHLHLIELLAHHEVLVVRKLFILHVLINESILSEINLNRHIRLWIILPILLTFCLILVIISSIIAV